MKLDHSGTAGCRADVIVSIASEEGRVAERRETVSLKPGVNGMEWTLEIPSAKYWTPDDPNLYTATVRVEGSDEESVRFGMRQLTIKGNRFELNGIKPANGK